MSRLELSFAIGGYDRTRALMGPDFWSYGVAANRGTLEAFARRHHAQGVSEHLVNVDQMFHPATYVEIEQGVERALEAPRRHYRQAALGAHPPAMRFALARSRASRGLNSSHA